MSNKISKPTNLSSTILRLFKKLLKYKGRLIVACSCMAISSAATVRGTYYLKPLVNDYIVPLIGKSIESKSFVQTLMSTIHGENYVLVDFFKVLLLMAMFYLISMVAAIIESRSMVLLGNNVLYDLRVELFEKLMNRPFKDIACENSGAIMTRFSSDMDSLNNMLKRSLPYLINGAITCVSIFATMFVINYKLTLVVVISTSVMIPLMNFLAKSSMRHTSSQQKYIMEQSSIAKEYTQGQEMVRILNMQQNAKEQFQDNNEKLFEHTFKASWSVNSIFSLTGGINQLGFALLLFAGSFLTLKGGADLGTVALFAQYYNNFNKPLTDMTRQLGNILSALAGAERIFNAMDIASEEDLGTITLVNCVLNNNDTPIEAASYTGNFAWKDSNKLIPLKGKITLNNVVFGYQPERKVIDNISLEINPSETIAILGTTGAGKTTLISLLNRLYDVWSGEILFDGIDIKNIKKESLRNALATVSQDAHLFTGTVADNLRFGNLDATNEMLNSSLKLSGADFFVSCMPQGINTLLEKGGVNLSQGEKQLLTIARAAVANLPVLVLDEATSSVDTYTEQKINQAFDNLMKDKTVFVIAHRLNTVKNADRIAILDKGKIVELGTPMELIQKKGYYYKLLNTNATM